ncbi:MAG TPA: hypothetical protein PLJ27_16195, partial [Polyangiaceae bacterium]|nr:hypothetical protein [Polyangiaceae bacterium]
CTHNRWEVMSPQDTASQQVQVWAVDLPWAQQVPVWTVEAAWAGAFVLSQCAPFAPAPARTIASTTTKYLTA